MKNERAANCSNGRRRSAQPLPRGAQPGSRDRSATPANRALQLREQTQAVGAQRRVLVHDHHLVEERIDRGPQLRQPAQSAPAYSRCAVAAATASRSARMES